MKRYLLCLAGLVVCAPAIATISYTVEVAPGMAGVIVTMDVPNPGSKLELEIPRWAPGSYRYSDPFRNVAAFTAWNGSTALDVSKSGDSTWTVNSSGADRVRVRYMMKGAVSGETHHFSGPSTYMYVKGRKSERTFLKLNLPPGWDSACGLDAVGAHQYVADDYDVLADNPVSVGNFIRDTYMSRGVPHEIIYYRGSVNLVDRAKTKKACEVVSEAHADFFGGFPFRKYVWHFSVNPNIGGAGGLEHLSSTQIGMAAGLSYSTVSVFSHEYFHAWNVKRIRSAVLGPFDYQVLPKTGALWWLEGVTDYYADVLLYRGGFSTDPQFLESISDNTLTVRRNPERFNISPYDSSYRVSEASNGRGNSQGLGVSYYPTGWIAGFCLDVELRSLTGGKKTLDNVTWDLWNMTKDSQPGFEEGAIRQLLVKHGGPKMGEVYDTWIMKPGEMPVEKQLAKLGLEMKEILVPVPNVGALMSLSGNGRVIIREPAAGSKFEPADQVIRVGSVDLEGAHITEVAARYEQAEALLLKKKPVNVTVLRDGKPITFSITATEESRKRTTVQKMKSMNSTQKKLYSSFMKKF